jgi:hypothetical protein
MNIMVYGWPVSRYPNAPRCFISVRGTGFGTELWSRFAREKWLCFTSLIRVKKNSGKPYRAGGT